MATSFKDSLAVLAKARFPILYVETFEERRALAEIQVTVGPGGLLPSPRPLHTWSITAGLVDPEGKSAPGTTDPLRALDAAQHTDHAATFAFLDLHAHLGDGARPADPAIVRKLRELSMDFQNGALPRTLDNLIDANAGNRRLHISLSETDRDRLVRASLGLTESEAEGALALAMATDGVLDASDVDTVLQEKKQAVRKSGLLEYVDTDIDLDGVGGLDNLKRWLSRRDSSWLAEAKEYGIPAPRGVLITGVPGCGKSLTAKAIAATWRLPLLRLDIGKVFSGIVGSSESNLRTAIRSAEAAAPAVLWVDEIEKGFAGVSGTGDSGTASRVFGSFLTWMQEKTTPVFVIATSNNVQSLPPELLRKGRFDEIFFVDLPAPREREQIWSLHVRKHIGAAPHHAGFVFDDALRADLVAVTEGFSGAEIEQAVVAALFDAFSERREIRGGDLRLAVERSVPLSVTQAESLAGIRVWASERAVSASDSSAGPSLHSPAHPTTAPAGGAAPAARNEPAGRRVEF
ncbi:MAG: ATPase [Actinomyces sp.]|nr:MAG: ATPase [Actinomyces sp.]